MATHAGMTTEEFEKIVRDWLATARHPKTGRAYNEMIYQPMVELLRYLRTNGFKTTSSPAAAWSWPNPTGVWRANSNPKFLTAKDTQR